MKKSNNFGKRYFLRIGVGIILALRLLAGSAGAATLTVDDSDGANYIRIQDAIDNASAGDTILVHSGTYYENVNVNKQLILRGIDNGGGKPVVNAVGSSSAITLSAGGTILDGFNAIGAGGYSNAGITVTSNNNLLSGNNAYNNFIGISLEFSSNNMLRGNNADSNYDYYGSNGFGIYLFSSSNNTLSGNTASNNSYGIELYNSGNNTLTGNTASNNSYGLDLSGSNYNNNLTGNTASNNSYGIFLYSGNNTLIGNNAYSNRDGIYLSTSSGNNTLINNRMTENKYNFGLPEQSVSNFDNRIDTSNLVDGKSIFYLQGAVDTVYDSSTNAGILFCINCVNVTVKGLNLNKNEYGVFFWNTTRSRIENVKSMNNRNGIYLGFSSNNTLSGNNAFNNDYGGIFQDSSGNNTLSGNNASNNIYGIFISDSSNNTLSGNTANSNNHDGIILSSSGNNILSGNTANSNSYYGINLYSSSNNTLTGNNANLNNYNGILLGHSSNNILSGNIANSNNNFGIFLSSSGNNTLSGNIANSNDNDGIFLEFSSNNTLNENDAGSNNRYGIHLDYSKSNTLINNRMTENKYNFVLDGLSFSDFDAQIDTSNLVDGKPIYYIKDAIDTIYDSSTNAGIFFCINCVNITVKDLNLNKNGYGVVFWNTTRSRIENVKSANNGNGIYLYFSSNNTLSGNNASNNGYGIYLYSSGYNTLTGNIMTVNEKNFGLDGTHDSDFNNSIDISNLADRKSIYYVKNSKNAVYDSSTNAATFYCISCVNVTIMDLNLSKNSAGIFFRNTTSSIIRNVNASNNEFGINLDYSSNNTLSFNTASNNGFGIYLWYSDSNSIYDNFFNNSHNFSIYGNNTWNTTRTSGTNIICGSHLGGNVWANPNGTGFSQTCADADNNGICDSPFILDSSNIDYLPLAYKPQATPGENIISRYASQDGRVHKSGAVQAVMDYFAGIITKQNAITVVTAYFGGYQSTNASSIPISINDFTFKTYSVLSNESGNLFFSPFSISTALSMAAEGAGGKTVEEMRKVLGLSNESSANRAGFQSLLNSLNANNTGYNLSTANAIWIEKTFSSRQEFSSALSTYYNALAQQADFANNADGERTNINNWVAGKTNNKILDLIPSGGLNSFTRLVIVNAIYFNGNWAQQFNKSDTQNATFFVSQSRNVSVPMMHLSKSENASYYADNELKALEMDYQGDNLSMLILLPDQNHSLPEIEAGLSSAGISDIRAKLVRQPVQVWLPRFSMTKSKEMSDLLKGLGMINAFDPDAADFSGINSTWGLYVSGIYHKAFINVNETGTEAAAATAVIVGATAIEVFPEFRADHPFLFFIIDKPTGTILFMGRVADPTSET
ncbi:Serpin (serine protease inhibitor) [uncultured archaeon]|nr:Serpin (serine protease inhibitor) [uncultured archaeon]